MKHIKEYSIREEENPERTEWCYHQKKEGILGNTLGMTESKEVKVDDCKIYCTINGLSFSEMRTIANEMRALLKQHGFDIEHSKKES